MDQAALIDRIAEVLERLPGLGGAFLGGSHGRDEADAFSDVDVYVVVADADDIPDLLPRLEQSVGEISPILFRKVLPNARTINCITTDWLRFDLTVVSGVELAFVGGRRREAAVRPAGTRWNAVRYARECPCAYRRCNPRHRQRIHPGPRPVHGRQGAQ